MATFQLSNKNKKEKDIKNIKKVVGWTLLFVSTFIFLFSATELLPFLNRFLLGAFGVFVYPFSIVTFVVSLALLNNKKYVMPKRYIIFLGLTIFFMIAIIQLIIIGKPDGLTYGQYIGLNYSKKWTAGGMLIGFLPTSLGYLMGLVATYILLAILFAASLAFFIEAVISLRKTTIAQQPLKLQIHEKEEVKKPFNPRENKEKTEKVFNREQTTSADSQVMLEGTRIEEEKKELSAREKLGLVGFKRNFENVYSVSDAREERMEREITLPREDFRRQEEKPDNMSMREYLLSTPTVDLKKFRERSEQVKKNNFAMINSQNKEDGKEEEVQEEEFQDDGYFLPPQSEQYKLFEKDNEESEQSFEETNEEPEEQYGNLTEVNPDEITDEAEDIIRSVYEQEKIEREENQGFIEPEEDYSQNNYQEETERYEEKSYKQEETNDDFIVDNKQNSYNFEEEKQEESVSDFKNFIDFGDLDDEKEEENNFVEPIEEPQNDRENLLRERREFSRDRNPLQERNSERNNILSERRDFGERKFEREDLSRPKPFDEMERRKNMVEVKEEKKEEKVKPYKYKRPPLDLITTVSEDLSIFNEEIPAKRVALENALESFGIAAKVQNVVVGPTVTRYELQMPDGISVKRVLNLDADIAYALSAKGIRIEAPVPGRSVVGIEVPNSKVAMVGIKDVLQSKEFALSPSPLTFALGKDITNAVKVCNLQKMPHLLVAGTTGSGKSVCLNALIISMLYKASPDDVKFIMIDPKQVELSMYEGLPHMVIPKVITDPTKAVNALQWAVDEMERRFKLLSEEGVRNIDEYNKIEKVVEHKVKKMPFLVIIFDEFADFMLVAKNDIEERIRRITQKARAAGIHLILATQRPSTDVVTGTIKSNLPARIGFKVASRFDSETILGMPGAEKLVGYGDMLYKPTDIPYRIQGCFIDTPETKAFVNYIIENNEEVFDEEAFNAINNPGKSSNGNGGDGNNGVDQLLPQALKLCIDAGVASTTMVQRKLSIGYPRAARIVDQMEERGYISAAEGSKPRSVYISIEEFYSIFGDIYD